MVEGLETLQTDDGEQLAFHIANREVRTRPLVVWLGGFRSDLSGTKATELVAHCERREWPCLRLDYRGHGQSSGAFEDGTISLWTQDALSVINHVQQGHQRPVVLIGSSMGAWIMARVGLMLGDQLAGMLGIASALDFTGALLWEMLSDDQKRELKTDGTIRVPSNYDDEDFVISQTLIDDGQRCMMLAGLIDLACPVRLIHGQGDVDVPYEFSLRFAEALASDDVVIELVKNGDHRLSTPDGLRRIKRMLDDLMDSVTT